MARDILRMAAAGVRISGTQWQRQVDSAWDLLGRHRAFALSIGCRVEGDMVECTPEQGEALARWWDANAGGLS